MSSAVYLKCLNVNSNYIIDLIYISSVFTKWIIGFFAQDVKYIAKQLFYK